jgi:formylmethanofuran dehydrogenase subunit E
MLATEVLQNVNNERLKDQLVKVGEFHGYLSPGVVIGVLMMKYACELLGCRLEEDIFVTVETRNCIPDAATALANCTIGNKRLRIVDYGKMALTMTKRDDPEGVRIILDPKETVKYPAIHAWYLNERDVPQREVVEEVLEAGRDILSFEYVRIEIPKEERKEVVLCTECGEPFIPEKGEVKCRYSTGERYYGVRRL